MHTLTISYCTGMGVFLLIIFKNKDGETREPTRSIFTIPTAISKVSFAIAAKLSLATCYGGIPLLVWPRLSLAPRSKSVSTIGGIISNTFMEVSANCLRSEMENECSAALVAE